MPSAAAAAAVLAGMETGAGSRVTRLAKSTAASVVPVQPGKAHALSSLDNAMERHTVHLVFYYRSGPGVDRDRLKESLSEVLSLYPAMTGRLARGDGEGSAARGWTVRCNDAGVRMVDARAAATLDEWLATASSEEEMDLAYWEPMGAEPFIWSPYYIQLTEFADKSFALGLSCTHLHADPTCAAFFFHAWAAAHCCAPTPYPPFLHAPAFAVTASSASPPPASLLLSLKSTTPAPSPAAMSSATFHFPPAAMRALLSSLDPDTTPFAALAALFWRRIAAGGCGERELTLALDFRKRMHAPLPNGYYGSAVHFTRARANLGAGLAAVAAAVDRHVAGVPEEELWAAVEWLHARQSEAAGSEPFQMYGPELTCMALDHLPLYGAEFVAGEAPARVACRVGGADGEGLVIVMPAAEGEAARNVVVTLPAEVTARICRDAEMLRYGADVVFGPKVELGAQA